MNIISKKVPSRLRKLFQETIEKLLAKGFREGPKLQKKLVDIARPKNSIFHCMYDWNDTSAAEKFRMEQAGQYVRSIGIKIHVNKTIGYVTTKMNNSIRLPDNVSREYFTIDEANSRIDVRKALVLQLRSDMMAFIQRYANYRKMFGGTLQRIIVEMGRLIRQIR